MAGLIPFDFLLFRDGNIFTRFRIISILLVFINLFVYEKNKTEINLVSNTKKIQFHLYFPGVLYNWVYSFFLFNTTFTTHYQMVLLANFLTIIITTIFAYKFWREQYFIQITALIPLILIPFIRPEILMDCVYLGLFHLLMFYLAYFMRKRFILTMFERYHHTSSLVPKNIARHIAISDADLNLDNVFVPQERFTVCLCSDWRNYQQLANEHKPEYIEKLFEKFYDIVFDELDYIIPNGNYFADWTADELFIIFFSDNENEKEVLENSLRFAQSLANKVFKKVNSELSSKLIYDIGIASGKGLLGLQGPKKLKKTTITGESAGTAKRLETEAKTIRFAKKIPDTHNPLIIMDYALFAYTSTCDTFIQDKIEKIKATTKNIKDQHFYLMQS